MNSIENSADQIQTGTGGNSLPSDKVNVSYTKTRIHTPDQNLLKQNRIISTASPAKWLESYRMLRTRCLQYMDSMQWKTVAITSTSSGSGNTLTAINLAISMAMELDRTALLVDCNLRRPNVDRVFGINTTVGLSDYLLNDTELSSMLVNPGVERLVVLPAGKPLFNATEMLRSPKMVRLVNELKSRYPSRIIIFDMPPILSHDDTLGFSPYVDCVLLVVEEGHTKTDELKNAASLLKDTNVLGAVFNKATDNKIGFNEAV